MDYVLGNVYISEDEVKALIPLLEQLKTPQVVWRGLGIREDRIEDLYSEKYHWVYRPTSTTTDLGIALHFCHMGEMLSTECVLLKILLPVNFPVVDVNFFKRKTRIDEKELLLLPKINNNRLCFEIVDKQKANDAEVISYLSMHPQRFNRWNGKQIINNFLLITVKAYYTQTDE